jgi:hypothetical protein
MRSVAVLFACVSVAGAGCVSLSREVFQFNKIPAGGVSAGVVEIAAEDGSFRISAGAPFLPPFSQGDGCVAKPTAQNAAAGLASGARPVVVTLEGGRRLYGLLSLCGAPPSAKGPATRSYQLQVPSEYIEATSGGRVSVVYEPFSSSSVPAQAWILWLSETSFTRLAPETPVASTAAALDAQLAAAVKLRKAGWIALGAGAGLALIGVGTLTGEARDGVKLGVGIPFIAVGAVGLMLGPSFHASANQLGRKLQREVLGGVRLVPLVGRDGGGAVLSVRF